MGVSLFVVFHRQMKMLKLPEECPCHLAKHSAASALSINYRETETKIVTFQLIKGWKNKGENQHILLVTKCPIIKWNRLGSLLRRIIFYQSKLKFNLNSFYSFNDSDEFQILADFDWPQWHQHDSQIMNTGNGWFVNVKFRKPVGGSRMSRFFFILLSNISHMFWSTKLINGRQNGFSWSVDRWIFAIFFFAGIDMRSAEYSVRIG